MSGILDLQQLIAEMDPVLIDELYVFCTFPGEQYGDRPELQPIAMVQEQEGLTLVLSEGQAKAHGTIYDGLFKRITLNVHSSLEAVGLTALFATRLAKVGISANVVAGFYHDHIFVPADMAEQALQALLTE